MLKVSDVASSVETSDMVAFQTIPGSVLGSSTKFDKAKKRKNKTKKKIRKLFK